MEGENLQALLLDGDLMLVDDVVVSDELPGGGIVPLPGGGDRLSDRILHLGRQFADQPLQVADLLGKMSSHSF